MGTARNVALDALVACEKPGAWSDGYLKKASVHQAHPHALRHTFATTCLQAHCDIKTLSELLGHSDAAVTLKKYVHSDMKRKRREINRVFENF